MTKREMFVAIREVVVDNADMVTFIDNEIKLLDKKRSASRKPTATQIENDSCKADIVAYLIEVDQPKSIRELQSGVPSIASFTNQRVTHMLSALVKEGKLVKVYVKKTPYYSMA